MFQSTSQNSQNNIDICSLVPLFVQHRISDTIYIYMYQPSFPVAFPLSHFCGAIPRGTKLISSKSPRGSGNAPWIPLLKLHLKPGKKHKRSHVLGAEVGRGSQGSLKRERGVVWWRYPMIFLDPKKSSKMVPPCHPIEMDLGFKNWAWKIWRIFLVL